MNVEEQLAKLVSIPSYVDSKNDEKEIGEYLITRLKEIDNKTPIIKQMIKDRGRFNVYVKQKNPKLFVIGHIDTVQPSSNWDTDPFKPVIKDGNLYGLGSSDMKGPLAAFLAALENVKERIDTSNLSMLFYIDEEYDFLGMKQFVLERPNVKPDLVLSLDGGEKVRSGCRGLIELDLEVIGKSGHSSKPFNGVNAITSIVEITKILEEELKKINDSELGYGTVNLAYLRGSKITKGGDEIEWKREGNVIPDYVDCTLEVRTVSQEINAKYIIQRLEKLGDATGVKVNVKRIRHDIIPWESANKDRAMEEIKGVYDKCSLPFETEDIKFSGYVDIGMLEGIINAPKYTIGTSGSNEHAPNEYVKISSLYNAQMIYEEMLLKFCSK